MRVEKVEMENGKSISTLMWLEVMAFFHSPRPHAAIDLKIELHAANASKMENDLQNGK